MFHFRVTNPKLKNKKLHFELLTRWFKNKKFHSMGGLSFSHIWVTNVKLTNKKTYLIIAVSKLHGLPHSVMFLVFSLLCCEYICDIYLSMQDFNGLWKFNSIFINWITTCWSIYIMEGKQNFFIRNGLFVDNRAYVDIFVKCLRLVLVYRLS